MKVIFQGDAAPGVTVVSNEFIDRYMPSANGAFVKVYLYLLRHQGEEDCGQLRTHGGRCKTCLTPLAARGINCGRFYGARETNRRGGSAAIYGSAAICGRAAARGKEYRASGGACAFGEVGDKRSGEAGDRVAAGKIAG